LFLCFPAPIPSLCAMVAGCWSLKASLPFLPLDCFLAFPLFCLLFSSLLASYGTHDEGRPYFHHPPPFYAFQSPTSFPPPLNLLFLVLSCIVYNCGRLRNAHSKNFSFFFPPPIFHSCPPGGGLLLSAVRNPDLPCSPISGFTVLCRTKEKGFARWWTCRPPPHLNPLSCIKHLSPLPQPFPSSPPDRLENYNLESPFFLLYCHPSFAYLFSDKRGSILTFSRVSLAYPFPTGLREKKAIF